MVLDGQVGCALALNPAYDLVKSYRQAPHIGFLKLRTDSDLKFFVQTWGPLVLFPRDEVEPGIAVMPAKRYWIFQRWLKALVNLLGAIKQSHCERECLLEFLAAESESDNAVVEGPSPPAIHFVLQKLPPYPEAPVDRWLERADLKSVRKAVASLLWITQLVPGAGLEVAWKAGHPHISARWKVNSLRDALTWMVWQDEWMQHPLLFCRECSEPFRPQTAHSRIYCSSACGHRVAARNWRRKDSERKKGRRKRR